MPFPPNWPTYIPKDKLANWFEAYVEAMELNYWPATEFVGGPVRRSVASLVRRAASRRRHAAGDAPATHRDGDRRQRHSESSGHSPLPNFAGSVLHSSQYDDGEAWKGKNAIVIGTGNSGHDIAQDLHSSGANVTVVQRSPTLIVNIEPSAQLPYALYDEGPPSGGLRPDRRVDAVCAHAEEPYPLHRASEETWTRSCSTGWRRSASSSTSAMTDRVAVQISHARRGLLLQRRLFRPDCGGHDKAGAVR